MVASLSQLLDLMRHHGATRVYAKNLAPNDNSKNQVYLGGDFSALNILPHGEIYSDATVNAGAIRDRAKARVNFFWIDEAGRHHAPDTGLILYPKYPEVRMSGFLKSCPEAPAEIMRVRDKGRLLVLGITSDGDVLGFAADAAHPVVAEVRAHDWPTIGVFLELPLHAGEAKSPKDRLLSELRRIWRLNWITSQKLAANGAKQPYSARNGGGYTLEAELGITPNGYAEPDFMGWEVKQYGVQDFVKFTPKSPVTLLTPEPTGGIYREKGLAEFMKRFGYEDRSGKADRINFGGRYDCLSGLHKLTGLRMMMTGFDAQSGKITDFDGALNLVDGNGEIAASWPFKGLMAHWNRKHAQAAYVPSLFREPPPEYYFGPSVLLCEQTDFLFFLKAFSAGTIYYDPAIKVENASSAKPNSKKRSQFRVAHADLPRLYKFHEIIAL